MSTGSSFKTYVAVLLAMGFWGMSFVWTSLVFQYYHPITTIFLRLIVSSLFLFLLMFLMKRWEMIRREDVGLMLMSAFFNPFVYFLGENFGLKSSSSTIASVVIATIPVFTPLVAFYSLREKMSKMNLLGIFLSFIGIIIMLVKNDLTLNASFLGISCLFLAVAAAVVYSVLLKKLSSRYSPLTIITWQNLLGIIYFLPLFLIFEASHFIQVKPDLRLLSSLLMLAIFASSLSYVFFAYSVKNIGVTRSNVFTNLIPVITAIASFFILGEEFTWVKIVGMAIVIGGVFISQLNKIRMIYRS
ncbi:MAG: DMT family transporter [Bacteroidetes bacterium]|nr:DMT family transporter [Bacteroidota bacterium]